MLCAAQGPGGLRSAVSGGQITVDVGPNDQQITITSTSGETLTVKVAPGKTTSIPVPNVPSGSILTVRIGTGRNSRVVLVEIIGTGP